MRTRSLMLAFALAGCLCTGAHANYDPVDSPIVTASELMHTHGYEAPAQLAMTDASAFMVADAKLASNESLQRMPETAAFGISTARTSTSHAFTAHDVGRKNDAGEGMSWERRAALTALAFLVCIAAGLLASAYRQPKPDGMTYG